MIVHQPIQEMDSGQVCISARFELQKPLPYLPQKLWYRFPEQYAKHLAPRADGFAAAALLVAMFAGEDLTLRGPVSPKLAYGLYEYRNVFHAWSPKLFQMVDIQFEKLEPPPPIQSNRAVASAFSGGVDSFFTLWTNLPENQKIPGAQVTHGLFIHGLDLRLDDEANYRAVAEQYRGLYKDLGLELILASTNAYQFAEFRIDWVYFNGAPLIGAAHLFSPFLCRFYVPSGFPSLTNLAPNGSHPLTDHWLSSEVMDVIHHGAETNRFDKLALLANWPVTYDRLRVCSDKKRLDVFQNCSACDKCYRTITILSLMNALPKYNNFVQKLSISDYFRWGFFTLLNIRHTREIRRRAFRSGRIGIALLIGVAIFLRKIKLLLLKTFKSLLSKEQLFWIKRRVYQSEPREIPENR